jgi:hypothetical protein
MKRHSGLALIVLLASTALPLSAEDASAPADQVKAAFVLNFAKFATWPEPTGGSAPPLSVCAVKPSPVGEALAAEEGRRVAGRELRVDFVRLPGRLAGCRLLYVPRMEDLRLRRTLAALAELPVLTVSDQPGFVDAGGMIGLVQVEARLRFEVNLNAVAAAGLRLDPKLLRLAARLLGHPANKEQTHEIP